MTRFALHDLEKLAVLAGLAPIAWLAPQRSWAPICHRLAVLARTLLPGRRRDFERWLPRALVEASELTTAEFADRYIASTYEEVVGILADYRPGGWQPSTRLIGGEKIDAALARGRGVILWASESEFSHQPGFRAITRAGYPFGLLSRPEHGMFQSKLGIRFLNQIGTRIEGRYIGERIVIGGAGGLGALRTLRERLEANGIVLISIGDAALRTRAIPIFDGEMRLSTGPVTLARHSGAVLLPIFLRRTGSNAFEAYVEDALNLSEDDPEAPYRQLGVLLDRYVRRDPVGWRAWRHGWSGPTAS